MAAEALARKAAVVVVTAVVVVALAAGVSVLTAPPAPSQLAELNNSEYDVDDVAVTPEPASGEIEPDADTAGTVVIDDAHANRIQDSALTPFIRGLQRAGFEIEFHEGGSLRSSLANASAFVIIDPGFGYSESEVAALQEFTGDGGRVLLFAEPNRITVSGGLAPSITEQQANVERIATAYDLSFSPSFVYHQEDNDGNYKRVVAEPVNDASDAGDEVVVDTAAYVVSTGSATVLLRTPEETHTSGTDDVDRYAVAVRTGNLIAVTDSSLLAPEEYNVADNEAFLAYLIEFLAGGDRPAPADRDDDAAEDGQEALGPPPGVVGAV